MSTFVGWHVLIILGVLVVLAAVVTAVVLAVVFALRAANRRGPGQGRPYSG